MIRPNSLFPSGFSDQVIFTAGPVPDTTSEKWRQTSGFNYFCNLLEGTLGFNPILFNTNAPQVTGTLLLMIINTLFLGRILDTSSEVNLKLMTVERA